MDSVKILVIDDDSSFLESLRDLLEACGYEVFTACNGQEGLEKAVHVVPGIIILDVMMASDTEGFDVARKIHDIPVLKNTGVILVTGVVEELNLATPLSSDDAWLPVDRILDKPIDPERLLREVRKVLDGK